MARRQRTFVITRTAFQQAAAASDAGEGPEVDYDEIYLAAGCQERLPAALAAFESEYISRVAPVLRAQGFPPDRIDEAAQRVRTDLLLPHDGEHTIRLCRYAGTGRLASLVRVSAVRYARRDLAPAPTRELLEFWRPHEPAVSLLVGELQQHFKEAFAAAITRLSAKEKLLLRMLFVEDLSYREVAALLAMSKSSVCRQLVSVEQRLVADLSAAWRQRTGETTQEGLRELIAGQLDLSISRLLRSTQHK